MSGARINRMGTGKLSIKFGTGDARRIVHSMFTVVDVLGGYNCIIGRDTLSEIHACMSIRALVLMYLSDLGVQQEILAD